MGLKLKILYFTDSIANGGGIQEMIMQWLEHFDNSRIQVDLLTYRHVRKDNFIERFERYGGKVYFISTFVSVKTFFKSFYDVDTFFRKHHDYDILHAHGSSKTYFVIKYAKKYGIKHRILHSHATQFVKPNKFANLMAGILRNGVRKITTDFFACSSEAGIFLFGQEKYDQGRIKVIHNGINIGTYYFNDRIREEMRKKLDLCNNKVIGNVGRLTRQKNHNFLLNVFKECIKIDSSAVLLLVGAGELEGELKKQATELQIKDKVLFLGYRTDIAELLQAMDIFVMTSLFEGLPVSAVEAQAAALPCLFADTISKEAKLIDSSEYMGLDKSYVIWANKIIEIINKTTRVSTTEKLIQSGYDIGIESIKLQEYYERIVLE